VSRYQKGKTNLDFTEANDSEWQWHPLGCMQVCTSLQTDNHASTPPLSFFTGRMPFLPPNQQHQSTEGTEVCLLNTNMNCAKMAEPIEILFGNIVVLLQELVLAYWTLKHALGMHVGL